MAFSNTCACGRLAESFGGLCDRCVALQALGLDMHASDVQIENSYRTMVKVWHPDRFQSDPKLRLAAEEKLKEINAAHEYLAQGLVAQEAPRKSWQRAPDAPGPQTSFVAADVEEPEAKASKPKPESEPDEVRRILRRQRKVSMPKFLLKVGFALGAVATVAILWFVIDAILSSNPRTASEWDQFKAQMSRDIHASGLRLWGGATENLHSQKEEPAPAAAGPQQPLPPQQPPQQQTVAVAPATAGSETSRRVASPTHVAPAGQGAKPYVTSGLTPMEVLTILGNPTSSSGEKMFYNGSEIDFKNGHVAGWKIEPGKAAIRVKLWPETAPVPGLTRFAIGSSKSDVIALQGTPTLFSDNKFGYGKSVVFFQSDRVVGWNEDPGSVRLRVAH